MLETELTATGEMAELRARVRTLEIRLERLEQAGLAAFPSPENVPAPAATAMPTALDTETAAATIFTRIAMLCFVLLGALILRVLTQQDILGAGFGTLLGFAYAGHLVVLSLMPNRFGGLARENSVFQCSGVGLAFIIAIEAALRTQALSRFAAMLSIAGFALLAVGMGIYHRKPALMGTGIIGGILALVALDLQESTVVLQLALVVLLAGAGLALSWRTRAHWLRPLTTCLVLLLLPAGLFFAGKAPLVSKGLLAASGAFWLATLAQHLLAYRQLGRTAAWLPITTLWLAGMQYGVHWPLMGVTTGGIAALALLCVALCARRFSEATAGLSGMMAAAAFAGAIGWAMLDRTGLLCAIGGLGLWLAGRKASPDRAAIFATLLMLSATVVGLAQLLRPPVAVSGLVAMSLSALILIFHYVANGRTGTEPYSGLAARLAPVALAAGLALLLGLFWELLNRLFPQPAQLLLSQTVALVVTALALTFWGHVAHRRSPLFCGLACMVLALAKVMIVDLMSLKSFYMLTSLVLVGLASIAVSVILRRRC